MILSDLLHRPVEDADGNRVGAVLDVRFVLDGPPDRHLAQARLHGLLVSPHVHSSFLGYERTSMTGPRLLARYLRWRNRDTFLVLWSDVARSGPGTVVLREGARRYSPRLPA